MLFTEILLSSRKIFQETLINVRELNVYLFLGVPGFEGNFGEFGTLILIRNWRDSACSSGRRGCFLQG